MKGAAAIAAVGVLVAACGGGSGSKATPATSGAPTSAAAATSAGAAATSAGTGGASSPAAATSAATASGSTASGGTATAIGGNFKPGGTVVISNEQGQTWPCQFNPFNPAVNSEADGFVYEPLVYVNALKNGAETPMLASSYTWSADQKSIVFTIRDGVKWNDGQAFSAADVAYTFNLMKKNTALDLYALWTGAGLNSVVAAANKVTLTFNQPAKPYFYNFADQVGIVPEHIFSTGDAAAHPDTWADKAPVGTGPFMVNPCTPNNITYTANPHYWMPNEPHIQKVQYPAYLDNGPANLDLATGKAQWGSQYIPNIESFYLKKSKDNHYWFPPTQNVYLFPNNDKSHPATANLAVRQAIAYALDRSTIAKIGESGYWPAANQTGIVLPTFQNYFDASALSTAGYDKPNIAKAASLLTGAGYSKSKPLNLTVITITGYTDWDASLAVIKQELAPLGINLTIQDLEQQTYDSKFYDGNYDLAYGGEASAGPSPYYELRQVLYSKNSAAIGKQANGNYERYLNPAVDTLFDQYATADATTQVSLIKQISSYMIKDVPVIPTTGSGDWFQYNTSDIQGWPTQADPYAQPAAYIVPDTGQVLLHLYSKAAQ
ncbi:ABC transporter substrate-binding protein [Acidothermaceae bacterium B102]|nr:ABC transporter substrate-binding protein [Acidothermaceae bacterium B102]